MRKNPTALIVIIMACFASSAGADFIPLEEAIEQTRHGCKRRIGNDIETVEKLVSESSLNKKEQKRSLRELKKIAARVEESTYPENIDFFRPILPLNALHRDVFRVYSEVLSQNSEAPLTIWHSNRFDRLNLFAQPTANLPKLKTVMMINERRSVAINITNNSPDERLVEVTVPLIPTGCILKFFQVEYVDSRKHNAVPSALIPIDTAYGKAATQVPAGMTRQIWLTPAVERRGPLALANVDRPITCARWVDSGEELEFSQNLDAGIFTLNATGYPYGTHLAVHIAELD